MNTSKGTILPEPIVRKRMAPKTKQEIAISQISRDHDIVAVCDGRTTPIWAVFDRLICAKYIKDHIDIDEGYEPVIMILSSKPISGYCISGRKLFASEALDVDTGECHTLHYRLRCELSNIGVSSYSRFWIKIITALKEDECANTQNRIGEK